MLLSIMRDALGSSDGEKAHAFMTGTIRSLLGAMTVRTQSGYSTVSLIADAEVWFFSKEGYLAREVHEASVLHRVKTTGHAAL